jgi:hypothetical protein
VDLPIGNPSKRHLAVESKENGAKARSESRMDFSAIQWLPAAE